MKVSLSIISLLVLFAAVESLAEQLNSAERFNQLKQYEILRNGQFQIPNLVDHVKPYLANLKNQKAESLSISEECSSHLKLWGDSFTTETWAMEMLDGFSKIPEGIFSGHTVSYGDFDECLAVRANGESSNFKGKHCTAILSPAQNCANSSQLAIRNQVKADSAVAILAFLMPTVGACMPNSCSKDEIQEVLRNALGTTDLGVCITVQNCETDDKPKLKTNDIIMIAILAIIAVLCIFGTAIDVFLNWNTAAEKRIKHTKATQSLIAFSLYTNTKKWLSTDGGSDNLGAIHGIRFLSTCWVVLAHTYSTMSPNLWNMFELLEIFNKENWTLYPIVNGTVSVDTFFTVSAILMAYLLLKTLDKTNGKINIPKLYIHRYLRLTPTYALLVGIMATWFQYLRPGPLTYNLKYNAESCQNNWWHNLLYINNLVTYDVTDQSNVQCHGESWYLANDMQFFLISPFLLFALWKWKLIGIIVLGGFTAASVVVPFAVTFHYNVDMTLMPFSTGLQKYMDKNYMKPWMRFGPYAVGLWAGYFLYKIRTRKVPIRLPKWVVIAGWMTSTATALAIIFGVIPHFQMDSTYNRTASAFYGGFHRFAWGAVISWIVLACTMGYGGIINTFLSWKVFIPLGRLSFCTYLISFWLQNLMQMSMRQAVTYDLCYAIMLFFGQMVMSLLVAFVACMTLESPFIVLEKIFLGRDTPPPAKKPVLKEPFENSSSSDGNSNNNNNNSNNNSETHIKGSNAV